QEEGEDGVKKASKIEEIKRVREELGLDLAAAKEYVENRSLAETDTPPEVIDDSEIEALVREGHMVRANKLYRKAHGVDMKTAHTAVKEIAKMVRKIE
ncbi:MAG: hypothetical protein V3T30_06340, partial [Thermodesulfobacteriota bacterium]